MKIHNDKQGNEQKRERNRIREFILTMIGVTFTTLYAYTSVIIIELNSIFIDINPLFIYGCGVVLSLVIYLEIIFKFIELCNSEKNISINMVYKYIVALVIMFFLILTVLFEYSRVKEIEIFYFEGKNFIEINRELYGFFKAGTEDEEALKRKLNTIIKNSLKDVRNNKPFMLGVADLNSFPDAKDFINKRALIAIRYGEIQGINVGVTDKSKIEGEKIYNILKTITNEKERNRIYNEVDIKISNEVEKHLENIFAKLVIYFLLVYSAVWLINIIGLVLILKLFNALIADFWNDKNPNHLISELQLSEDEKKKEEPLKEEKNIETLLEKGLEKKKEIKFLAFDILYMIFSVFAIGNIFINIIMLSEGLNKVTFLLYLWFIINGLKISEKYFDYLESKKKKKKFIQKVYLEKSEQLSKSTVDNWLRAKENEKEKLIVIYDLIKTTIVLIGSITIVLLTFLQGERLSFIVESEKGLDYVLIALSILPLAINLALFLANLKLFVTHSYTVWKIETEILVVQYLRDKMDESKNRHNRYK